MSVEVLTSCWSLFHLNVTLALKGWNLESVGVFCQFQRCQDSLIVLSGKNRICICVCLFMCRISEESRFSLNVGFQKLQIYFLVWMCLCVAFQHHGVCCRWSCCWRICFILGLLFSCLAFCSSQRCSSCLSAPVSACPESLKTRTMSTFLPLWASLKARYPEGALYHWQLKFLIGKKKKEEFFLCEGKAKFDS